MNIDEIRVAIKTRKYNEKVKEVTGARRFDLVEEVIGKTIGYIKK